MRSASCLILVAIGGTAWSSSPQEAVKAAAADVMKQPARVRPYLRYLSGFAIPEKKREVRYKVLNFHVHGLSRETFFTPPALVPGTKDLYRVDYRDYGWDRETWEKLASVEPYFHGKVTLVNPLDAVTKPRTRTVVKPWPGGVWPGNGKEYKKGEFNYSYEEKLEEPPPGGIVKGEVKSAVPIWVDPKEAAALHTATQSQAPIVRSDWFVFYTAIQAGRKVGYYDFLGLGKKQADFENLIGRDRERSKRARREIGGVLGRSGVTLNNRAIYTFDEGHWVTADYKSSTDLQNVLRLLDKGTEPPEGDASEQYGFLPNKLFAFWLQNAKGERQDFAPDFIASDKRSTGTDSRVHIGLSCIRCHVEGLRPINDWARRQYDGNNRVGVKGDLDPYKDDAAYEKIKRFRQLYTTDLQEKIEDDRRLYARALLKLTGLKPAEMAAAYADAWDEFFEKDMLIDDVAREWGVKTEFMLKAFETAAVQGKLDPVPAGLLKKKKDATGKVVPDPIELRREHFEEIYAHGHEILRGYRP